MKKRIILGLIVAAAFSAPFILIEFLLVAVLHLKISLMPVFLVTLLGGCFFSVTTLSILTLIDYSFAKNYKRAKTIFPVEEKSFDVTIDFQTAFERLKNTLPLIGARMDYCNVTEGIIKASTGWSWKSWGEIIEIKIIKNKYTTIHVKSKPLVRTTALDFGRNYENIQAFCSNFSDIING